MRKKLVGFFSFAAVVIVIIASLKVLNWLPVLLQEDTLRRYGSVEEISAKLDIKEIYVPSYFPQDFRWPPSEILAQGRPVTAIIMEFKHARDEDIGLVLSQSASEDFVPDTRIKLVKVKEKVPYLLKGRRAVLEVGSCGNDEQCSSMAWNEGIFKIRVIMKSTPFEVIKISESMID